MRTAPTRSTVRRGMASRGLRFSACLCVAVAGLLAAPALSGAGFIIEEIAVDDPPGAAAFAFTPDELAAPVGQRVRWSRGVDGDARHSVTQDDRLFRMPPFSGPNIDFMLRFSAGTFPYYCEIHGSPGRGMDGVVRVPPGVDTDPLGANFDVFWIFDDLRETGELFDVRYRRQGTSKWKRWIRNSPLESAEFGLDNEPERAVVGRAYEFSVRSKDGDNPRRRSDWSPVLVVVP